MTETFTFHTDPGHGWVEVPLQVIQELDINKDISSYSYTDGRNVYLEEDCDAGKFVAAFEKVNGSRPNFVEKYTEYTHIRNLPPFLAGKS